MDYQCDHVSTVGLKSWNSAMTPDHGVPLAPMPAMLTRDERVVRQDCLGYLMRRVEADS